ncbi:MAG TPA: hypothetical protein VGP25_16405 [Gemmatimonadaceae bacterium]|jgi:hypothetical protein|nr:hypothetical protein [Gemmatimonadaceae bacterium]
MKSPSADFTHLFDRAVAACAAAQSLAAKSAEAVARARATRASSRRVRALVTETREAWAIADLVNADMRGEVERVARTLRESGVDNSAAAATVRAHIRFVLYDGGLTERDAEPVVARASHWVDQVYAAA